jgi:hypothetical protein
LVFCSVCKDQSLRGRKRHSMRNAKVTVPCHPMRPGKLPCEAMRAVQPSFPAFAARPFACRLTATI